MLLATYTGVLIGATAVPAWHTHRSLLPLHFGIAGLGSAAGILELLGYRLRAAQRDQLAGHRRGNDPVARAVQETRRGDRSVHEGTSGRMLKTAEILTGPLALVLRACGLVPFAAAAFIVGSFISRFGWVMAGRASAKDPAAVFASQS